MDWLRLLRALDADRIEQVEVKRRQKIGVATDDDDTPDDNGLTPNDWRIIIKSDRLLGIDRASDE